MKLVNNSARAISIGGVMLTPHQPADVDDSYNDNPRVKQLLEDKVLERAQESGQQPARSARGRSARHG